MKRGNRFEHKQVHGHSCTRMHAHRVFTFDPADMKKVSMSNSSLERAMEHPIKVTTRRETTSSEITVRRRKTDRERRYSAPPSDKKGAINRDSVGSLDYLSESQGRCVCVCD